MLMRCRRGFHGVSIDVLKQAALESGFRYNPDGSEYGDGHFHLDLGLSSKEASDYTKDEEADKNYKPANADFSHEEQHKKEQNDKGKEDKKEERKPIKVNVSVGGHQTSTTIDTNDINSLSDFWREISRWLNWNGTR